MRDWNKIEDRREATLLFVDALNNDADLRAACKSSSDKARATFASVGEFTSIPDDVVFTVVEENSPERDKIVMIVLPDAPLDNLDVGFDILGCTRH